MSSPDSWLDRWLADKERAGCSDQTLAGARWVADQLSRRLGPALISRDPSHWTVTDVRHLRSRLRQRPWLLQTVRGALRDSGNPLHRNVPSAPRFGSERRPPLSRDQTDILLRALRKDRLLRLAALLTLAQGLEPRLWTHLRLADLDESKSRLRLVTYRLGQRREQWRSLHPAVPPALRDYLWVRRRTVRHFLRQEPEGRVPDELFIHRWRGRLRGYGREAPPHWVRRMGVRLAEQGIRVSMNTESLRRTGVTIFLSELTRSADSIDNDPVSELQRFLGHRTRWTTVDYLRRIAGVPGPTTPARLRSVVAHLGSAAAAGGGGPRRRP